MANKACKLAMMPSGLYSSSLLYKVLFVFSSRSCSGSHEYRAFLKDRGNAHIMIRTAGRGRLTES